MNTMTAWLAEGFAEIPEFAIRAVLDSIVTTWNRRHMTTAALLLAASGTAKLGWFLILVGSLFLLVGLLGAIGKVQAEAHAAGQAGKPSPTAVGIGDLLKLLIEALVKAGTWGVCTAAGIVLILVGLILTGNNIL